MPEHGQHLKHERPLRSTQPTCLMNRPGRPSSVFLFGIILKEAVATLQRFYLNPRYKVYPVLMAVIGQGAPDLTQLLEVQGGMYPERIRCYQLLQYAMENLAYHVTDLMPRAGVLGTHIKSAVFELVKNGKRFPDGYFWQIELDRLQFNSEGRTENVGISEAFMLMVGVFFSRALITTLLMKPGEYGLSNQTLTDVGERNIKVLATVMLFLVRLVYAPSTAPIMPMPGEVANFMFSDEEFRHVHFRLRHSYLYCERLLRDWGREYIKRLRDAAINATTINANTSATR